MVFEQLYHKKITRKSTLKCTFDYYEIFHSRFALEPGTGVYYEHLKKSVDKKYFKEMDNLEEPVRCVFHSERKFVHMTEKKYFKRGKSCNCNVRSVSCRSMAVMTKTQTPTLEHRYDIAAIRTVNAKRLKVGRVIKLVEHVVSTIAV